MERVLDTLEADEHAPTTVRDRDSAERTHVADSLVALQLGCVREARRIADMGSGAGFPGLVIAIALPEAHVVLLESQRRKCDFLMRTSLAAEIENVTVVCSRAEDWREGTGTCDLVVARALGPQPVVLEYAAPLLRLGGHLVDWRGARNPADEAAADRAAADLGLARREIVAVTPFPEARNRHLHVFAKVGETPERFPRRAGVAAKRPLGS